MIARVILGRSRMDKMISVVLDWAHWHIMIRLLASVAMSRAMLGKSRCMLSLVEEEASIRGFGRFSVDG